MTNNTTTWAVEASFNAMTAAVEAKRKADNKMDSAIDVLWANGARSTDMISPDSKDRKDGKVSTATKEDYAKAKSAVVAGFTKAVQQLLDKPTKSLEDIDKANKRYWQQQIGARLKDFFDGLEKREAAANPEANTTQPKVTKPAIEKLGDAIDTAERILQGDGVFPDWFDVPTATKTIQTFRKVYKLKTKNKPVSIDAIV
tara:strand:+ start:370 stop:969 length:600 start_codon:yes stop_codon:yes gene_type:complete